LILQNDLIECMWKEIQLYCVIWLQYSLDPYILIKLQFWSIISKNLINTWFWSSNLIVWQ